MIDKKMEKAETPEIPNNKVMIKLNMNMLIVGFLAVLVFVSIIQTFTLANLISKKPSAAVSSGLAVDQTGGGSNLPAALKDVPQQQGGC